MATSILIFALVVAFVLANACVEAVNEGPQGCWRRSTLSDYLVGMRGSSVLSLSYIGFAIAELLVIFNQPHGLSAEVCWAISATGLMGVVATANVKMYARAPAWVFEFHKVLAGLAFAGGLAAGAIVLWGTPEVWLVAGGVVTSIALLLLAPRHPAWVEKALTAWVLAAMVAVVIKPL